MGTAKRERQKAGRQARLDQARIDQARRRRFRMVRNLVILGVVLVVGLFLYVRATDDESVTASGTTTSTTAADGVDEGADESADEGVDEGDATTTTAADPSSPTTLAEGATVTGETPCPPADGSAERTTTFEQPPPTCIDPARTYTAVFETSEGTVRVALDTEATPVAANNFVVLARYGYYDGTKLFRTNTNIGIIQGGSPHTQDNSDPGPGYTIEDEGFDDDVAVAGSGGPYRYQAGDLVYARPGGRPDSSSAQFFFCATDACAGLDSQGVYINFGRTTEGLEVLQAILDASPAGEGEPDALVVVESVTIEEASGQS